MADNHRSIRLRYPRDRTNTLNGYVFTDMQHAREWLFQEFVKPAEIKLDIVDVRYTICRRCGRPHCCPTIKVIEPISLAAVMCLAK
jgi:hypothetical protein